MAEVNNLEKIMPFLLFDNENDFYYLQILQRKKENPQLGSNSRVIKNYYIDSKESLLKRWDEIKDLCQMFNARASIRLNRRNYEKVAYKTMVNIANSMSNKEFSFIKKSYDRAVGNGHAEPKGGTTWILDWDARTIEPDDMRMLGKTIVPNESIHYLKPMTTVHSRNGIHIIVPPFDARDFKVAFPDVEIHKDNPTNLYIP